MTTSTSAATLVNVIAARGDATRDARAIRAASVVFVAALTSPSASSVTADYLD